MAVEKQHCDSIQRKIGNHNPKDFDGHVLFIPTD